MRSQQPRAQNKKKAGFLKSGLNTNADKLQEQVDILRRCIYGFLGICILAALAHCGLATAILLVVSSSNVQTTTTKPVRRKVSFA